MSSQIDILAGLPGTGKTERVLDEYRSALRQAHRRLRPGTTLWLSPTLRARRAVLERLPDDELPACFAPNVFTFDGFAEKILQSTRREITPISPVMKRLLLRRIVQQFQRSGRLRYFQTIAHTSGFLDLVESFIAELKRQETWPEHFTAACERRGSQTRNKDRELAQIYEACQERLLALNVYDSEGRFWSAREILAQGNRRPFTELSLVVVDGFIDFTHTQYEILRHLSEWADRILVTLPLELPLQRRDLFAKSHTALERFQRMESHGVRVRVTVRSPTHPLMERELGEAARGGRKSEVRGQRSEVRGQIAEAVDQGPRPALHHLASQLFSNPREVLRCDDAEGIQVLAATGHVGELEAIAEQIKRLLLQGVNGRDILVAVRSVEEEGERIEEQLRAAGVPVFRDAVVPLSRTPVVKALFAVLQLEAEGWPFARLTAVLGSNFFRPDWGELHQGRAIRAVGAQLRRMKLHSQREIILRALERRAHLEQSKESNQEATDPARSATLAYPLVKRLSDATARLRRTHDFAGWVTQIVMLGRELGIAPRARATLPIRGKCDAETLDAVAWESFEEQLFEAAKADQLLATDSRALSLSEFLDELRDLLASRAMPQLQSEDGCVRILDATQVRHLPVPYLFMAGLTENSFPSSRGDDCIYSEAERRELNAHGLALGHRTSHTQDEMLLFYLVATRARRQLVLSYPAVSSKGQPLFPSPYLTAVMDLFEPSALRPMPVGRLDPIPDGDHVFTSADLRLVAVLETLERRPQLLRRLVEQPASALMCRNLLAAVELLVQRFHSRGFTPYEGLLQLPRNLNALRDHYSPLFQFSATQFERYAYCPFQFFLADVLQVQPLESPEIVTDYQGRGVLVHRIVAMLLRESAERQPPGPFSSEEITSRFQQLLEEELGRRISETDLQKALTRIERTLLEEWGRAYAGQHDQYCTDVAAAWESAHTSLMPEIPFGDVPPEEHDSSQHPYGSLVFGKDGHETRVRGRIDRVDFARQGDQVVYTVIDYKTGRPPRFTLEDVQSGRALQLALYTLAVKRLGMLGSEALPFQMGYWSIRETGFTPGLKTGKKQSSLERLDAAVLHSLETMLEEIIPRLADGIRKGEFVIESQDADCTGRCSYHTICRVNQIRPLAESLGKKR